MTRLLFNKALSDDTVALGNLLAFHAQRLRMNLYEDFAEGGKMSRFIDGLANNDRSPSCFELNELNDTIRVLESVSDLSHYYNNIVKDKHRTEEPARLICAIGNVIKYCRGTVNSNFSMDAPPDTILPQTFIAEHEDALRAIMKQVLLLIPKNDANFNELKALCDGKTNAYFRS